MPLGDFLASQPILALFLAIGLGYAVGQINILGFSLGIGAVLFVGLVIGAIAPKAQIAGPIGLIGLIMFLYGIGILYGRQFFEGLSGPGRIYNLLAFVAVVAGARWWRWRSAACRRRHRRDPGHVRGLDDQHADPAGGARPDRRQDAVDRLLGHLSVRRDRPDPLLLLHDAGGEANLPAGAGALPHGARSPSNGCPRAASPWATLMQAAAGRRAGLQRAAGPSQSAARPESIHAAAWAMAC